MALNTQLSLLMRHFINPLPGCQCFSLNQVLFVLRGVGPERDELDVEVQGRVARDVHAVRVQDQLRPGGIER